MTTETAADRFAPRYFSIPDAKLADLKASLDKMIRKAARLGIEACSYTVGEAFDKPYICRFDLDSGSYKLIRFEGNAEELKLAEKDGDIRYRRFVEVEVAGPNPVLAGWEFVATLQHLRDEETGKVVNLLRVRPGVEAKIPEVFKTTPSTNCDHCNQHRQRTDTYVVRNVTTNEWKQIGSTCIKDFLGGIDPRTAAAILEWYYETEKLCGGDEDEGGERFSRGEARWPLRYALAVAAAIIREKGWTSRKTADEFGYSSTGMLVREALSTPEKFIVNETTEHKAHLENLRKLYEGGL